MDATGKIHIAGPLIGSVQKCTRCHARIDSNRTWADRAPSGWREGAEVYSGRGGMTVMDDFGKKRHGGTRPCGSPGQAAMYRGER